MKTLIIPLLIIGSSMIQAQSLSDENTVQSVRFIPAHTQLGRLKWDNGRAMINGQTIGVAPAFRFRDQANRIVLLGSIPNGQYDVAFTIDTYGQLLQSWHLTPRELEQRRTNRPGS